MHEENKKAVTRRLEAQAEFEKKLATRRPNLKKYLSAIENGTVQVKKKRLPEKIVRKIDFLEARGDELNTNLPKSEVWFQEKYLSFAIPSDEFNVRFGICCIPDVINRVYKYVIEIDGSIHQRKEIQIRDKEKDEIYRRCGFLVIRVIAHSETSFEKAINTILEFRNRP
ncbi:MAG: DUF559 domain-containing protein [Bdellovibrio sp.]|nr:DUF559 domain-containing protein [Bdellovibrio sp.]